MPFYKVTTHALLIEAKDPTEAAMSAYRRFEDATPSSFEIVGPDTEVNHVVLASEQRDEAITIDFGLRIARS